MFVENRIILNQSLYNFEKMIYDLNNKRNKKMIAKKKVTLKEPLRVTL